ncbi:MAG TPA: hypothetical protein VHX39_31500 [Acetobacteraceae bacterium]|jgi:hypothetical protein|nr:hypothetical protein [Acetobacteraceae bacterium]
MAKPIRLRLQHPILNNRQGAARRPHAPRALLHHMRELMPQQLLALHRIRLKPAGREIHVVAHGEGHRANTLRLGPHMHTHGGKIGPQRCLHLATHRIWQRLSSASD